MAEGEAGRSTETDGQDADAIPGETMLSTTSTPMMGAHLHAIGGAEQDQPGEQKDRRLQRPQDVGC